MNLRRFEWNRNKAEANVKKHRVSFETAVRVFADPFVLIEQDRVEEGELHWQALGTVDGSPCSWLPTQSTTTERAMISQLK
ncbi:BrnT family toxin [Neorhizobium lilium]|uniref:BrnT family toxin n=1 Tax=Neorhizobium lilium TaxID=2503024 RepID=UPI00269F308F